MPASKETELLSSFLSQEVSGGNDVVDAGVGTAEASEGIVEKQEVALEPTDEVVAKDSPIDWTDSDDVIADETLGVTVPDEAVLVMADEAIQSTTSIMAEEAPGEIPVSMADVVPETHEVTPVMADETLVGMANETLAGMADRTRVSIVHEIIPVVASFNIVIIVGSAAEEDQDIDSVDSEETIADEPQPLQIVPFAVLEIRGPIGCLWQLLGVSRCCAFFAGADCKVWRLHYPF